MTQIVETRPFPETFPPGRRQDWQDRAVSPSYVEEVAPAEASVFAAPPPIPWPRVFPGL
jgi:hypothetical protein